MEQLFTSGKHLNKLLTENSSSAVNKNTSVPLLNESPQRFSTSQVIEEPPKARLLEKLTLYS